MDVSERFCADNDLNMIIRSHQMMSRGYEIIHSGRVATVFSCPNYCDIPGNSGAFLRVYPRRLSDSTIASLHTQQQQRARAEAAALYSTLGETDGEFLSEETRTKEVEDEKTTVRWVYATRFQVAKRVKDKRAMLYAKAFQGMM